MKLKKFFSWSRLLLIVTALILGLGIYRWNAVKLLGNQLPMPFGYGVSIVLSGSMEPVLQVDDLVLIKEVAEVQVNDIIVFENESTLTIHRVVGIDGDRITTQGDANNAADAPIDHSAVKGKMVFRIPGAGKAVYCLRQPTVVVSMIILTFLLMELSYQKEKDKDQEELSDLRAEINQLLKELKENE